MGCGGAEEKQEVEQIHVAGDEEEEEVPKNVKEEKKVRRARTRSRGRF